MSAKELFESVQKGDTPAVIELLKGDAGGFVNSPNPESGEFPLHAAVKGRHVKLMDLLLARGANPNQGSEEQGSMKGYTAAHFAARQGDVDSLKVLAKHKADFSREAADGWAPLHCACFAGKRQAMIELLDGGAKIDGKNQHQLTALFFACSHGRVADVRELLSRGANIHLTDVQGDTLMHHTLHMQMSKLFEGEYEMPECQLDVAVVVALNGADVEAKNHQNEQAVEWIKEDLPSLLDVLKILSFNSDKFKASKTEWNYVTLLKAQVEHFLGMGLEMKHAFDLNERMKTLDSERLAAKKRREEERPAGGCPVMRGGRKKKGAAAAGAAPAASSGHPPMDQIPSDGSDPSAGACPFFQKKDGKPSQADEARTAQKAPPAGHGAGEIPADGSDPSAGACPFFQKKDGKPSQAQQQLQQQQKQQQQQHYIQAPESPRHGGDEVPKLDWAFVYHNRMQILLMTLCFFMGIYFEQVVGTRRRAIS